MTLALPGDDIVFAGEREDLEEICGNLLENAVKWAHGKVSVTVAGVAAGDIGQAVLRPDDRGRWPGHPAGQGAPGAERGRRLDETKPGTGLGLAIVADLVKEYGGELSLHPSALGGLKAAVRLRAVRA